MALNDDTGSGTDVPTGGTPLDHAGITRTDRQLTDLAAGVRPSGDDPGEERLLELFSNWRAELDAGPLPELPSAERIAVAYAPGVTPLAGRRGWVRGGGHHHGARPSLRHAVTGAAAVAAVLVGGLSVAAHDARPGDPLWGMTKTMFSGHAGDVELVGVLTDHLSEADAASQRGDRTTAARLLTEVSSQLEKVSDPSTRVELIRRRDAIERDLNRVQPSQVTSPSSAPAPVSAPPTTATPGPTAPAAVPVTPSPTAPPRGPGSTALRTTASPVPVIPVPLDGLSTTLQIPIDPQVLQDYLYPTTGQTPTAVPTDAQVSSAPSSAPAASTPGAVAPSPTAATR